MLIEATQTPITYKLRSGQVFVLQPGVPVELPDQAGQQLLRKAGCNARRVVAPRVKTVVLRARKPLTLELDGHRLTMGQWACFTVATDRAGGLLAQFPTQLERLTLPNVPPVEAALARPTVDAPDCGRTFRPGDSISWSRGGVTQAGTVDFTYTAEDGSAWLFTVGPDWSAVNEKFVALVKHPPCFACGTTRRWISIHGAIICGICHPPASENLIVRWTEEGGGA